MIALIVGDADMRKGSLRWALSGAGFEARETFTTDEADCSVSTHDPTGCVLLVEAGWLGKRAGSATWSSFLADHRDVPAVVVVRGEAEAEAEARQATREPHRVLMDNPVDAAAIAAAARRVSERQLGSTRRSSAEQTTGHRDPVDLEMRRRDWK